MMADYIGRKLSENGVKNIRIHDISRTHISHIINEIWKYKGLILGSCAYNSLMFPLMEHLTSELLHMGLKNKYLGLFGSYSWNGGGVKTLMTWNEQLGLELVADPADIYGKPSDDKYLQCDIIAQKMAEKVKQ
jgi:flavorubredoxin